MKLTKRFDQKSFIIVPIVATWAAYMAQFMISTNHLALSFWGWILPGLILGFEIKTRGKGELQNMTTNQFLVPVIYFVGSILGISLGAPLFLADGNFQSSIKSGNVLKIEKSIEKWPQSSERINVVSELLRNGNLPDRSIVIARKAIVFNPLNFESWKELLNQPNATDKERQEAINRMKKLDPYNQNLK